MTLAALIQWCEANAAREAGAALTVSGAGQAAEIYGDIANLLRDIHTPRPIAEYHEEMGPVLWWKFPIEESPYVGGPNDLGYKVETELLLRKDRKQYRRQVSMMVGGWPGYHTHWTPLPKVNQP